MKKKRLLWLIPLVLLLAVLIWAGVFYFILRNRSMQARPLVLIQYPLNHQQVELGADMIVHATARASAGIRRMELWVDDAQVGEVVNDVSLPTMILSASWVPQLAGEHTLIVRAVTRDGVYGQSTIFVEGIDPGTSESSTHIVEEGESIEEIAETYGVDSGAILDANNQLGSGGPQAGDELTIPGGGGGYTPPFDDWPGDTGGTDDTTDDPPSTVPDEPGSLQMLDVIFPDEPLPTTTDPVELEVEVLALQSRDTFESLHCYVNLAGSVPIWLPDADNDQSTDETFDSRADGTEWDVARYMAENNATTINWESHTPVPLDISCVGIQQGGLDSVDLGRVLDEVPPEQWGIQQAARSSGGESQFNLAYLVTYPEKDLDPDMEPPWNVQVSESRHGLSWEYLPDVDGEPVVDGFAIFLDGQLQFTVEGSDWDIRLPEEWLIAPCGDSYTFTVVAFRDSYPEGDYSPDSEPAILNGGEPGSAGCSRTLAVNFYSVITADIDNPRPISGAFWANEQSITFDGRIGDSSDPWILHENTEILVPQIFRETGDLYSEMIVELPDGNPAVHEHPIWLGFDFYRNGEKICSGDIALSDDQITAHYTGTIHTESPSGRPEDWCEVTFGVLPVTGSPVLEAGAQLPLPDLHVDHISYDPESGRHIINIKNTGNAAWLNHPLDVEATTRDGELISRYSFPSISLNPNQSMELNHRGFDWEPIMGACVMLDPDNAVREQIDRYEEQGIISRGRYCPRLPDLTIPAVRFNRDISALQVTIQNHGDTSAIESDYDGAVPGSWVLLKVETASGNTLEKNIFLRLGAHESINETWYLSEEDRGLMQGGYTIMVNSDGAIAETDTGNNSYTVESTKMLKIAWRQAGAWYCSLYRQWWGNLENHWTFNFKALLITGGSADTVASWHKDLDIDVDDHLRSWCSTGYITDWFEVGGDEVLLVSMDASMEMAAFSTRRSDGGSERLTSANGFGGVTVIPRDMDPGFYDHFVFTNGISHAESCGSAVGRTGFGPDPYDWDAGMHQWGRFYVDDTFGSGHEDRDPCYWSSTYMLYQAEEP